MSIKRRIYLTAARNQRSRIYKSQRKEREREKKDEREYRNAGQEILVYILMACPRIEVTSDPNIPWTPALERTGIFRTLILFHQRLFLQEIIVSV